MAVKIDDLHPTIRPMARTLLDLAAKEGIDLRITFGIRTFEQQEALYNQTCDGKDNDGDGKIDEADEKVTQAKPGQSFHNYGLAIDVCPFVKGKPDWKSKLWNRIGQLGKSVGFSWGGDWAKFKDLPHFEYPKNTSYKTLLTLKQTGKVDKDGFVILPS